MNINGNFQVSGGTSSNVSKIPVNMDRVGSKWDYLNNTRRKDPDNQCLCRDGPAPKSETRQVGSRNEIPNGSLDSDVEDNEAPITATTGENKNTKHEVKSAGSKAFIIYFAKLAKAPAKELIDFEFVESLLEGGAEVNSTDKHGQTVLHEVARNWHPDVAFFLLQYGAEINKVDKWGRTPLHSASAVDHVDMIEFLLRNGADINAKTLGELQSPIHYAAKFNAVRSLKILIDMKANVNDRDYKQRTPIFVAAETAREEATRYLVEHGAPAGVFDESGLSAMSLMIEKMPKIAEEALEQFMDIDRAFRKEYYYLNYLEQDPSSWKNCDEMKKHKKDVKKQGMKVRLCPTTPLKVAVNCHELDIMMHPVIQRLINVKWNQFGKWGSVFGAGFHLTYILIWTWLAIFLPRGDGAFYTPFSKFWWRAVLEFLGCLMTLYFILKQVWEVKTTRKDQNDYQLWRVRQLERDLPYCHPRWPNELQYLESEIKRVRALQTSFFKDAWNIMDWLTYIAVLVVIVTRVLAVFSGEKVAKSIHPKAYAIALIFMWLHFMKSCRPFTSLGPFITMLGYVMQDTLRFAFLFFEFFIPYVVAFWIIFGGSVNAQTMAKEKADPIDWLKFHDLTYSVWMVTLVADFNYDALIAVDRLMAQILVGTYFAVASVVCMNLYIALLSDTFARVYANATANAALLQATTILQIEKALSKNRKSRSDEYIQKNCNPLGVSQTAIPNGNDAASSYSKMLRQITGRFDAFEDSLKEMTNRDDDSYGGGGSGDYFEQRSPRVTGRKRSKHDMEPQIVESLLHSDSQIHYMRNEVREIHSILLNYVQGGKGTGARPRSMPASTLQTTQLFRSLSSIRPGETRLKGRMGSHKALVVPEESGENLMRQYLNRKLQGNEQFSARDTANKRGKKNRRNKGRKSRMHGLSMSAHELSQSWEDVSSLDVQSVI
eukprot:gene13784-15226_t